MVFRIVFIQDGNSIPCSYVTKYAWQREINGAKVWSFTDVYGRKFDVPAGDVLSFETL